MTIHLFPFDEFWWFYFGFTIFIVLLLSVDLGIFHRSARKVSFKEAGAWSFVWVTLALCFNFLLYQYALLRFPHDPRLMALPNFDPYVAARHVGLEFLAGYLVEYSLSVDNIFVFVVILNFFGIPSRNQHRVLFYGILGALILRALFIAAGAMLIQYYAVVLIFGIFLIVTGIKMMFAPEMQVEPEKNPLIRLFRKFVPVTAEFHGQRFFVRINRVWHATPMFVTLLAVELIDIVFAVDSVPAIFALTREPLIVYTSNVFAILGLRSMYFLLAGAMDKFHLLKYGLAVVLIFVGLKMVWLNDLYGGKFPIGISLGVIGVSIAASVSFSLLFPKKDDTPKEG